MLRHARMAAMRKLHRSVVWSGQSPVRAVHVGRGEIVWQDRCDAANGSKEPILLKNSKLGQSMDKSENNVLPIPQWAENREHFGGD
jgi:hypothetical protein